MAGRTAAEAASEQETLTRDPLMLHRAIVTQDRLCSEMLAAFMCPAPKADCPLTAQFQPSCKVPKSSQSAPQLPLSKAVEGYRRLSIFQI
jgi:hypothetical protein